MKNILKYLNLFHNIYLYEKYYEINRNLKIFYIIKNIF